jgi:hypothetical protein
MQAWTFTSPETWTRSAEAPAWPENADCNAYFATLGYTFQDRARHEDIGEFVGCWRLYHAHDAAAACAYALLVEDGAGCVVVWLPTFPDLLNYMAKYGELGQAEWQETEWEIMRTTIARAFRAWHGHADIRVCQKCDPDEYTLQRHLRAERRAAHQQRA